MQIRIAARRFRRSSAVLSAAWLLAWSLSAIGADVPQDPGQVKNADAKSEDLMQPYTDVIANAEVTFEMVPIRGGKFVMGSAVGKPDEAPRHEVEISAFWMGKYEVTWKEFDVWTFKLDVERRELEKVQPTRLEEKADAVTRPTRPYIDMTFGMGKEDGYPAISMTQAAARMYCKWLSRKTGRYYRLPTEAEWEYACRAGTTTDYSFGNDAAQLGDFAWFADNSGDAYHQVGKKKPNPWGLFDMHGNVAEWTLDQFIPGYQDFASKVSVNPLVIPQTVYPEAVRGGAWTNDPQELRSAARLGSHKDWKQQDPGMPTSIWYLTDAPFLGFRIVRPLVEPSAEEKAAKWDAGVDR